MVSINSCGCICLLIYQLTIAPLMPLKDLRTFLVRLLGLFPLLLITLWLLLVTGILHLRWPGEFSDAVCSFLRVSLIVNGSTVTIRDRSGFSVQGKTRNAASQLVCTANNKVRGGGGVHTIDIIPMPIPRFVPAPHEIRGSCSHDSATVCGCYTACRLFCDCCCSEVAKS